MTKENKYSLIILGGLGLIASGLLMWSIPLGLIFIGTYIVINFIILIENNKSKTK